MKRVLLFDLDGTLTDSAEGICRSVAHALSFFGIEAEPEQLHCYIGPPLNWSFAAYHGLDEEETTRAVTYFRARYGTVGKFENRVYDGIREMLTLLRDAGYRLGVATSKPLMFATQILKHFALADMFEYIAGTGEDERGGKAEVVTDAVAHFGVPTEDILMIGDREHDILGARAVGVETVGVLWGYGSREELSSHVPLGIVETPEELVAYLIS